MSVFWQIHRMTECVPYLLLSRYVHLSTCLPVCLSVYLSVLLLCLSVHLYCTCTTSADSFSSSGCLLSINFVHLSVNLSILCLLDNFFVLVVCSLCKLLCRKTQTTPVKSIILHQRCKYQSHPRTSLQMYVCS